MSTEPDEEEQRGTDAIELDGMGNEAVERFLRLMHEAGYDLKAVCRKVNDEAGVERTPPAAVEDGLSRELMNVPHILTLWYTESPYLDEKGRPKPLPKAGPGVSVESLLRQVNPALTLDETLHFLLRTRTVVRQGDLFVPVKRSISLRGTGLATHLRDLRIVLGLMRTCQHNDAKDGPSLFEFAAENAALPRSAVALLRSRTFATGMQFLADEDDRMQRAATVGDPGEPLVSRGVGVFEFEDACLPIGTAVKDSGEK